MNSAPKLKSRKLTLPKSRSPVGSNGATPSDAELKSIKQKLIQQGVKYCLGAYVDIHGVPKGKFVPIDHFEHFAHGSELYTGYALDVFPWLNEMATTMNGLGWDIYSFDHEDGNSQFEFDFKYDNALTMADRYTFFRYMAKMIAAKHGLLATFMPKPFADKTGNGAHFNMSLADLKTGKNLFAVKPEDDPRGLGLSSLGYSFVAGILRHGRALCATLAPTVNSYKRLIRRGAMSYYSWAPVFNSFGTDNRTNSVL